MAIDYLAFRGELEPFSRSATIKVAAHNATDKSKAAADYVCGGVNDEVELNAAVQALPVGGGSIELSEGTFDIGTFIALDVSNVWIRGQGRSTLINSTEAFHFRVYTDTTGIIISDLASNGTQGLSCNGEVTIRNCFLSGTTLGLNTVSTGIAKIFGCKITGKLVNEGTITTLLGNEIDTLRTNVNILPATTAALKDVNKITTVIFV